MVVDEVVVSDGRGDQAGGLQPLSAAHLRGLLALPLHLRLVVDLRRRVLVLVGVGLGDGVVHQGGPPAQRQDLGVPQDGLLRHGGQVVGGVEVVEGEVDDLLRLDPLVVDVLEALEMHDEDGRQPPDLQLLGGGLRGAAVRAVVALLQALAGREGAQAAAQVHRAHRLRRAQRQRRVLHPRLHGTPRVKADSDWHILP